MKYLPPVFALLIFICLPRAAGQFKADNVTHVSFDSFSYSGQDPAAAESSAQSLPEGHYRNPILAGFFPDPSICRAGDDYYLVNSTFAFYPGLPIFHSKDLVNWKLIGHAVDRPEQFNFDGVTATSGMFAPAIEYHQGKFYLVCTNVRAGGNFVITADNPAGPWSEPAWLNFPGIDPSLFFDDDGRVWLVHNGDAPDNKPLYEGHRAVWLRAVDLEKMSVGEPTLLINGGVDLSKKPIWIEGPHVYKKDGWYYLNCAEGGTGDQHSQVIFRSKEITGPFEPWSKNPTLTQRDLDSKVPGAVTCTGHLDMLEGPDGRWWAVFLGVRPMPKSGLHTTGRETFMLPVSWSEDGWPSILPLGERVPLVVASPAGAALDPSYLKLSGDLSWTENFDGPELSPYWIMLRQPGDGPLYRVESGKLLLKPVAVKLFDLHHPAFLSRRVQHAKFAAQTQLELPLAQGVQAGIAIFQSEGNYYFLAAEQGAEGKTSLSVELSSSGRRRNADNVTTIHAATVDAGEKLHLRIKGDVNDLELAWSQDGEEWETYTPSQGIRPVSVQAAGGGIHFTGAVIGMHARVKQM